MAIGIGIGIGFGGMRGGAARLHARLSAIFGASLVGLWVGEDMIVNGSSNVTSWPGRVGGTLTPKIAGVLRTIAQINGRLASITDTYTTEACFISGSLPINSVFVVAVSPTLPFETYITLARQDQGSPYSQYFVASIGTSNFDNPVPGYAHYLDGTARHSVASGAHIFESDRSGSAVDYPIVIGGSPLSSGRVWYEAIACAVALSSTPTPLQRIRATIALKEYYGVAVTTDERIAALCPIDNPVVLAPLRTSAQSYGSVNAAFTAVGAPVIGANGATFDGVDDGLYLDSGASDEFTLIARIAVASPTAANKISIAAMARPSTSFAGWGLDVGTGSTKFRLSNAGVIITESTLDRDTATHAITIRRATGTNTLYFDGSSVASSVVGVSGYGRLCLGHISGAYTIFGGATIANAVLYHSALSPSDQAAVEAYVAAA